MIFMVVATLMMRVGQSWGVRRLASLRFQQMRYRGAVATEREYEIVRPQLDSRSYRIVEIGEIRALLCSDSDADEAAIGVSVRVGSFDDDENRPGLAHFHEHMVFLGTKSYPADGSFDEWLATVGGRSNAYTADEETNYYCCCNQEALGGAVQRLGEFFTAPEMRRDCVKREVDAVNSEYDMSLNDDGWRALSVVKATVDPRHPFSRFNCGNIHTLLASHQEDSSSENAAAYDALHEALWDWHKKYYTADRFRICIVGRQSLDELEVMLKTSPFAQIRTAPPPPPAVETSPDIDDNNKNKKVLLPWSNPTSLQQHTELVPVRELRSLQVAWPRTASHGLTRLAEVIASHIVGHEDVGSLYFELKRRGLIEALSFGSAMRWRESQLVELGLELTPAGEKQLDEVLAMSFAWLRLCQEADLASLERLSRDWCRVQQLKFEFSERESSVEGFASSIAEQLWEYPDQPLLAPQLFCFAPPEHDTSYRLATAVRAVLQTYTMETCFLMQMRPEIDDEESLLTERWHGAKYRSQPIEPRLLEAMSSTIRLDQLRLPRPNGFVATDVRVRPSATDGLRYLDSRLWRRYDYGDAPASVKRAPKAVVRFFLRPSSVPPPSVLAAQRLILNLVTAELNPERYDAGLAGMYFGASADSSTGITLSVSGFSDKLQTCLSLLIQSLFLAAHRLSSEEDFNHKTNPVSLDEIVQPASLLLNTGSTKIDLKDLEEKFGLEREELARRCDDRCRDEPASIAQSLAALTLDRKAVSFDEFGKAVRASNMRTSAALVKEALAATNIECYTAGNLDDADALNLMKTFRQAQDAFFGPSPQSSQESLRQLTMIPAGIEIAVEGRALRPSEPPGLAFVGSTTPHGVQDDEEPNSASRLIWQLWQIGEDTDAMTCGWNSAAERDAALVLLCQLAEPSAFRTLRTMEQLGYLVQADIDVLNGVSIFGVTVQSAKVDPIVLEERIFAWLDTFRAEIEAMSDADLDQTKNGLADSILNRATCLQDVVDRDLAEIRNQRRFFSRRSMRAQYIRDITSREHLLKILDDAILHPNKSRILRSRVFAPDLTPTSSLPEDKSQDKCILLRSFEDIRAFHNNQPQWPPAIRWNETVYINEQPPAVNQERF